MAPLLILGGKKLGNTSLEGTKSTYSRDVSMTTSVAATGFHSALIKMSVAIKHHF
jgi:hypothetical protein